MSKPAPYDHYETGPGTEFAPGVYRVVGSGDPVTLLKVTDPQGRRRATGAIVHASRAELAAEFEPAGNPDAGFDPVRLVRNLASGVVWSVRRFF